MTHRRLNVKLLIWLIVGSVVFCGGVYGLHEFQIRRNAASLLRAAAKAQEEGDIKKTYLTYLRYVRIVPDDDDAYILYASALADFAETPEANSQERMAAYDAVQKAILRAPDNEAILKKNVEFSLSPNLRDYKGALDYAERLIKMRPDDAEYQYLYASSLYVNRDTSGAIKKCYELIGYDEKTGEFNDSAIGATNVETYILLASVLRNQNTSPDEADRVIQRMVERNPESFEAFLNQGVYLFQKSEFAEAQKSLDRALELTPRRSDGPPGCGPCRHEPGPSRQSPQTGGTRLATASQGRAILPD